MAAAYGLGFLLPMAPVALVNGVLSKGGLILTTWQAGANFYIGNGPEATGTYAAPDFVEANPAREAADFAAEAERRAGRPLSPGEVSRFWFGEGLKRWRTDPVASGRLLAWKLRLVANDVEVPDNQDAESVRLLAAPGLGFAPVGFGLIGPFAALGAFAERGRRLRLFLAASTLVGLLSTAAFFVVGRYRLPWTPGLVLLAAAGLVDAARRLRTGRLRSLGARLLLLGLPTALLVFWPIPEPAPDRWGHVQIHLGIALVEAEQVDRAVDAFDEARAMGPGPASRVEELLSGPYRERASARPPAVAWRRSGGPAALTDVPACPPSPPGPRGTRRGPPPARCGDRDGCDGRGPPRTGGLVARRADGRGPTTGRGRPREGIDVVGRAVRRVGPPPGPPDSEYGPARPADKAPFRGR